MAALTIPQHETGTTRVFSLSMTAAEARKLRDDPVVQAEHLGAKVQTQSGVEVLALSDLGDMGLAGFLREGVDAHPADIARDQAKLAALDGWVMLVHSSAFASDGATLSPAAALTLIGTYAQTPAEPAQVNLWAEAAQPYTGAQTETPRQHANPGARGSWVVVALALLAFSVIWWVLG